MKRIGSLIFAVIILAGCASKTENAANQRQSNYDRQIAAAERAFAELDNASPSEPSQKPSDCGVSGENCPPKNQPVVPDKPKPDLPQPVIIEYKTSPGAVADKAQPKEGSKYPMVNGFPVWFSDPSYGGYIGGVGVAKEQKGGYAVQKRVAVALAQADLARSVSVNVYSESESERYAVDTRVQNYYKEKFSTMSKHDAEEYINSPIVMDEWLNSASNELYVWVVLAK